MTPDLLRTAMKIAHARARRYYDAEAKIGRFDLTYAQWFKSALKTEMQSFRVVYVMRKNADVVAKMTTEERRARQNDIGAQIAEMRI
jgi:hypothetical protein